LARERIAFTEITGQVNIKDRGDIVKRFNRENSGPQVPSTQTFVVLFSLLGFGYRLEVLKNICNQLSSILKLIKNKFYLNCFIVFGKLKATHFHFLDKVMLLSLAAGGVGLNLVGANHLFMLDMHWNPQMESQACDRVYR
jgi:hypothetical protein